MFIEENILIFSAIVIISDIILAFIMIFKIKNRTQNTPPPSQPIPQTPVPQPQKPPSEQKKSSKQLSDGQAMAMLIFLMIIFVSVGSALIYYGGQNIRSWTAQTQAQVIDIDEDRDSDGSTYALIVKYNANGQTITAESHIHKSGRYNSMIGKTVDIYYNPNDPQSIYILGFDSIIEVYIGLAFVSIIEIPLLIATILYLIGARARDYLVQILERHSYFFQALFAICLISFIAFCFSPISIGDEIDSYIFQLFR